MSLLIEIVTPRGNRQIHDITSDGLRILAQPGVVYRLIDSATGRYPEQIYLRRKGDDLELRTDVDAQGPEVIIEGHFHHLGSPVVAEASDGLLYIYQPEGGTEAMAENSTPAGIAYQLPDSGIDSTPMIWGDSMELMSLSQSFGKLDYTPERFKSLFSLGSDVLKTAGAGVTAIMLANNVDTDKDDSVYIGGSLVGGPLLDTQKLKVTIYKEDGEEIVSNLEIDSESGRFQYRMIDGYTGGVHFRVVLDNDNDPDYMDEGSAKGKDLDTPLQAISYIESGQNLNVYITPLTHLAATRALGDETNLKDAEVTAKDEIAKVNKNVGKLFGIDGDISLIEPETAIDKEGNSKEADAYGKALALISGAEDEDNSERDRTGDVVKLLNAAIDEDKDTGDLSFKNGTTDEGKEAIKILAEGATKSGSALDISPSELMDEIHKVLSQEDKTPPVVESVRLKGIDGDKSEKSGLIKGDTIQVILTISEVVTVDTVVDDDGEISVAPKAKVILGGQERYATYSEGSGSNSLIFEYQIQGGDQAIAGDVRLVLEESKPHFPGGTKIVDVAGNDLITPKQKPTEEAIKLTVDALAPELAVNKGLSPANGGVIGSTQNLELTFTEEISLGSGFIEIYQEGSTTFIERIAMNDQRVSISSDKRTLLIDPSKALIAETKYYVLVDSGIITDINGNEFAGFNDKASWSFTASNFNIGIADIAANNHINKEEAADQLPLNVTLTVGSGSISDNAIGSYRVVKVNSGGSDGSEFDKGEFQKGDSGNWHVDHFTNKELPNGDYRLIVEFKDAGTTGERSLHFTVDKTEPNTPKLQITRESDLGISDSDGSTSDTTPTIAITYGSEEVAAAEGDRVDLYQGKSNKLITTFIVTEAHIKGDEATISYTVTDSLSDGDYIYSSRVVDRAGNVGLKSQPLEIEISTSAPKITEFTSDTKDGDYNHGSSIELIANVDRKLVIGGKVIVTLNSGAEVELIVDQNDTTRLIGTYIIGKEENSLDSDGEKEELKVTGIRLGDYSRENIPQSLTENAMISTDVPSRDNLHNNNDIYVDNEAKAVESFDFKANTGTSEPDDGWIINDTTPTFTVEGESGSTYTLFVDRDNSGSLNDETNELLYKTTNKTITVPSTKRLADGEYDNISIFQTDKAGNISPVTKLGKKLIIDTKEPELNLSGIDGDVSSDRTNYVTTANLEEGSGLSPINGAGVTELNSIESVKFNIDIPSGSNSIETDADADFYISYGGSNDALPTDNDGAKLTIAGTSLLVNYNQSENSYTLSAADDGVLNADSVGDIIDSIKLHYTGAEDSLDEGSLNVRITITDSAGNSDTQTSTIKIDDTAPAAPSLTIDDLEVALAPTDDKDSPLQYKVSSDGGGVFGDIANTEDSIHTLERPSAQDSVTNYQFLATDDAGNQSEVVKVYVASSAGADFATAGITGVDIAGDEYYLGGTASDTIDAGAGDDTITAGAGDDTITAGAGDDTITLAEGRDTLLYTAATDGNDTIADFAVGGDGDTIDLTSLLEGYTDSNVDDYISAVDIGGKVMLQIDHDGDKDFTPSSTNSVVQITLTDVTYSDFNLAAFIANNLQLPEA